MASAIAGTVVAVGTYKKKSDFTFYLNWERISENNFYTISTHLYTVFVVHVVKKFRSPKKSEGKKLHDMKRSAISNKKKLDILLKVPSYSVTYIRRKRTRY